MERSEVGGSEIYARPLVNIYFMRLILYIVYRWKIMYNISKKFSPPSPVEYARIEVVGPSKDEKF